MKPSRSFTWAALSLPLLALTWHLTKGREPALPAVQAPKSLEAPPMCPWREPQVDMKRFFPGATHFRYETSAFSNKLSNVRKRLGRWPTADEHPLYWHRVYGKKQPLGAILTKRVKGEYGAIEIVLAIQDNKVAGMRIQRMREPQSIAQTLNSANWQRSFVGKTSRNGWQLGKDVPSVQPEARNSAQAVIEAVRTLLVLHEISES